MSAEAPVFIVGVPRSGTSLLSRMLSAHSELAISPETRYYTDFAPECDKADCLAEDDRTASFLDFLFERQPIQDLDGHRQAETYLREELKQHPLTHAGILAALCRFHVQAQDKPRWGEKTPAHLNHVPRIISDFPDAHIVCIVRDPRDVSLSLRSVPWNELTPIQHAHRWQAATSRIVAYRSRFPGQATWLRYEDLVYETEQTVREMCREIELAYEPTMMAFHKEEPSSFDPEREPWKERARSPIDASRAQRWKQQMPDHEVHAIESITQPGLERFGYGLRDPDLSPIGYARLLGLHLEHRIRWGRHELDSFVKRRLRGPAFVD